MQLNTIFLKNLKSNGWANSAKPFLLAVSGGVDSMVMAHLFLDSGLSFAVAHCNYQLRGADADNDEKLLKEWCEQHQVRFFVNHFETEVIAKEWKKGIQETARKLRYDWFNKLCNEQDFKYIATAHHANDSVETLLMNLFKGTGIRGLQGIPQQNGAIIRPLLFATRKDINEYATENKIAFREDASNHSNKYLRNAVRHELIPKIQEYFPEVNERLYESMERFTEIGMIYNEAIDAKLKKLCEQRGKDCYVPIRKLKKSNPLSTLCYELFKPYGFTKDQLPQILDLIDADSGKYLLSPTHKLIKDRDFLIVTVLDTTQTDLISIDSLPAKTSVPEASFSFSVISKPSVIATSSDIALIDLKEIQFPLVLRRWRQGDYFYPLGMDKKKKKLSRFFIDQKIPLHEKEKIWVLESNKKIVWLAGWRLDERFKITDKTTDVLKIEMRLY